MLPFSVNRIENLKNDLKHLTSFIDINYPFRKKTPRLKRALLIELIDLMTL